MSVILNETYGVNVETYFQFAKSDHRGHSKLKSEGIALVTVQLIIATLWLINVLLQSRSN